MIQMRDPLRRRSRSRAARRRRRRRRRRPLRVRNLQVVRSQPAPRVEHDLRNENETARRVFAALRAYTHVCTHAGTHEGRYAPIRVTDDHRERTI